MQECPVCKKQVLQLVPLSWLPLPGGECLPCHQARCSNVVYITLGRRDFLQSLDGIAASTDMFVYKQSMLITHVGQQIEQLLVSDGYDVNDKTVRSCIEQMSNSFLLHMDFGLRKFVTTMIFLYWAASL